MSETRPILAAATVYFAAVFAIGFVLGTLRTLVLAPLLGPFAAVALEIPVMLAAAWVIAPRVVKGFGVPAKPQARLWMGAVAFVLLILAEMALARVAFGLSTGMFLAGYTTPHGLLGLSGQLAFALIPWVQGRRQP